MLRQIKRNGCHWPSLHPTAAPINCCPHTAGRAAAEENGTRAPSQEAAHSFAEARSGFSRLVLVGMNGKEVRGLDEWWVEM